MSREEIGTLIIVILKARNLNDKHKFRKQDVFAKIGLNGKEEKTKVDIKGGQHPVWDDEVRFPVLKAETAKFRSLEISCWSKEPRDEDLLGKATLDISKIIQTGEFDEWVPLAIDDNVRGDIYLEMTYYSNGPAPPQPVAPPQAAPTPKPQQQQQQQQQQQRPQAVGPTASNLAGLGVPGAGLMRRPSKLSPSERLSRPAYYYQQSPPQSYQDNRRGGSPSPHPQQQPYAPHTDSRYPAHPGQHGRQSSLPPLPEPEAPHARPHRQSAAQAPPPNLLRPGASPNPRPYSDPSIPTSPTASSQPNPYLTPSQNSRPSTAPSTPGPANPYLTSTGTTPPPNTYGQQQHVVYQPTAPVSYTPVPQQQPPHSYTPAPQQPPAPSYTPAPQQPPPQSYTPVPQQPQQSYTPAPPNHSQTLPCSSTPAPSGPPPFWSQAPSEGGPGVGGFAFPVPSITATEADTGSYPPGGWPGPPPPRVTSPYDSQYPGHRRVSDPGEDLGYNPRYQSPLPLPPGAKRDPTPQAQPSGPPPPPKPHSPSPPPTRRPQSQPRREPSPPKAQSGMNSERLMRLKFMEEEERRRQEQEKKDLELAMQLDRELNLS